MGSPRGGTFAWAHGAFGAIAVVAVICAVATRAQAAGGSFDRLPAPAPEGDAVAPTTSRAAYVAGELGSGVGGVFLSAVAGIATVVVLYRTVLRPPSDCTGDMCGLGEALLSAGGGGLVLAGGYIAGIPSFIWLGGDGQRGRGHLSAAILGSLAGLAADVGITLAVIKADGGLGGPWGYAMTVLALPVITSVVGFELSVHDGASSPAAVAAPSVAPFVAPVTEHGGFTAGLAGSF